MALTTRIYTFFCGRLVGTDDFGNRYYEQKNPPQGRTRRWVVYRGKAEASKVPPEWHGWLHYSTDVLPSRRHRAHYGWEKPPLPNVTGTVNAYLPPGHLGKGGHHAPTVAKVEPWRP